MWHVYLRERSVDLVYMPETADGKIWSGTVELHRGAPSPIDHPEIEHAFLGIINPEIHREFIRHRWVFDIPSYYEGLPNTGERRRYLLLTASGGDLNWNLVLKLPYGTPQHVYRRICEAFGASLKGAAMQPVEGNNPVPKPASLSPQPVPKADTVPPATQEGIKSITSQAG